MGKIFNKSKVEFDVYNDVLSSAKSISEEHLFIAINLIHDFRVSEERELRFRTFCNSDNIKDCLDEYYDNCIKNILPPEVPDFCRTDYKIADGTIATGYCCSGFDRNIKLATVMNLNVLFQPFKEALNQYSTFGKVPSWLKLKDALQTDSDKKSDTITALMNFEEFDKWLTRQFQPFELSKAKYLIELFFIILNELKALNKPYKPVFWVTDWEKLIDYINSAPTNIERWNQSVGVPNKYEGWQIVIQYPANAVECLYRPTQLDGGFFPEHFPPPPNSEHFYGGFTMDLAGEDKIFLPEYIHQQINEFKLDYWKNSGYLIGRVDNKNYELTILREKHYRKLVSHYTDVNMWMKSPIDYDIIS